MICTSRLTLFSLLWLTTSVAWTCPFCTAIRPTLSQRRETAAQAALAECVSAESGQATFRLHKVLKGADRLSLDKPLTIDTDEALEPGSLALLFGQDSLLAPGVEWRLERINEVGYAYFARAPDLRTPTAERLRYFVRYLEHAEPLVAEDAYNEFGHASFDQVALVAADFSSEELRHWLGDGNVPAARKGFYGLALGLAGDEQARPKNLAFLESLVLKPADDFRAGFDGILGGFLVAGGEPALQAIEERFLANPDAADGDVRHVVSALRFYWEYGREIRPERLRSAMRQLLARPEFAAAALIDLARWQDWQALDTVAGLYTAQPPPSPATRRAIIGYLLACPKPAAFEALESLRQHDPAGVKQAEQQLSQFGGGLRRGDR